MKRFESNQLQFSHPFICLYCCFYISFDNLAILLVVVGSVVLCGLLYFGYTRSAGGSGGYKNDDIYSPFKTAESRLSERKSGPQYDDRSGDSRNPLTNKL